MKGKCVFIILFLLGVAEIISAQEIYVSPAGKDVNPGTKNRPVLSFVRAQAMANKFSANTSVTVIFENGIYYLPETIRFTNADSKKPGATVTYKAANEGKAVLSGGSLLKLSWKPYRNEIFVADIPAGISIDQLYINGERQRMARFPNAVVGKNVFDAWELNHSAMVDSTSDPLQPQRISRWKNPQGGYLHAMHEYLWGDMHWIITGKNNDTALNYEGGWQNNRPSKMHPLYRMVENIFEELDTPGEWYCNVKEQKLYYMPLPGTSLAAAKVEVVRLRQLIEVTGSKEKPVTGVQFHGFTFRHAARTFMDNKEPLLRSDWTVYRGGAIFFDGAANCSISNCEFDQVGGNAIFINKYNRHITIKGCYIHHAGANGIAFVGDPSSVRSPLFRYGKQDYQNIDTTPGPAGNNYPEDCLVEDCLITMTGRDEKQTAPVQISMSHKIRVSHCSIYDVPRAGINISEGTFGGHIIEYCDVFNTVLETGDHGSFNSWGRDRYWSPDGKETSNAVKKNPGMPSWDMLDVNIIRNNRWRCDHGWDIDLDDGSSNYKIYNNLLLNGGLKLREGYSRIATNNIIINNSLHLHDWYPESGDVFKSNIVFTAYSPAVMDHSILLNGKWGKEIDSNFFVCGKDQMDRYAGNGCDSHSINGNPLFENAATGNFRITNGSPVSKTGFVNFLMQQFGVTKPSLKAIAKTPLLPEVSITIANAINKETAASFYWMEVELKEPKGNELSAYGVGYDAGGVALKNVSENSAAAKTGFYSGDLIQAIDGVSIKDIAGMQDFINNIKANKTSFVFTVIRSQHTMNITLQQPILKVVQVGK